MKKIILILVASFVFFFGFKFVSASVVINEVMYEPQGTDATSGGEWIEIYNNGSETIDLTEWKFFDSVGNTSNHGLTLTLGSFNLAPDEYAIISKDTTAFQDFFSGFLGNLFKSSFTLSVDSESKQETLIIRDSDLVAIDTITYSSNQGASGDGNSLQLQSDNSSWKANTPSPGLENTDLVSGGGEENNDNDEEDTTGGEDEDSSDETTAETKATATPTLKTKILTKTLAFVGQPAEFSLDVKYGSSTYTTGKYFWNFGDGDSKEVINQPDKIYHTYFYPGEYAVSSEYYQSYLSQVPDSVNKITVKVVPLTVSISKVGDEKDFFIELTNNSSYEIDISRWTINTTGKIFTFPRNTAIMPKKQMTVSNRITGFVSGDEKDLKLISSAGDIVFDYNPPTIQTEIVAENPIPVPVSAPVKISSAEEDNNVEKIEIPEIEIPEETPEQMQILPVDLSAAAVQNDAGIGEDSNKYLFLGGLAGSLVLAGGLVYFIRRSRIPANLKEGSDFKILDE